MANTNSLNPGFSIVQGNRLDDLRNLVVSVMRRFPLAPLKTKLPWYRATVSPSG
jgi:exodeoxyribonuclease V gamma subunit